MALRTKTIEYAFTANTSNVASAIRLDFTQITVYIPETSSRTFRSVIVQTWVRDDQATAGSTTDWLIGIKLGAVAADDVTVTSTLTNTGDHQSAFFTRDVTSYFNTNFGAAGSQTCQVSLTITGIATNNQSAKLIITYEYDDAATTRVKTVRIPIESQIGLLTNVLAEVGTNQIPNLSTFLPEAFITYRDIFFEIYSNDAGNSTTGFSLELQTAADALYNTGTLNQTLNTAVQFYHIWKRTDLATNAAQAFKARSNNVTNRFNCLCVLLIVTYEYDHSSSTTILNSIMTRMGDEIGYVGGSASADQNRFVKTLLIEEPETITLKQSGVMCSVSDSGTDTIVIKCDVQATRTYTLTAGSVQSGNRYFLHRFDSGGAQGAGMTLARGQSTLTIDWYRTSASAGSLGTNFTGQIILNYTSGKHASGDGVHLHSTFWNVQNTPVGAVLVDSAAVAPNIPESNYYLEGFGYNLLGMWSPAAGGLSFSAEILAGEDVEEGWMPIYGSIFISDAEMGVITAWMTGRKYFKMHPTDPDTSVMAVEGSRKYRTMGTAALWSGIYACVTYHAITYTIAGQVLGYTGNGSGITINIYRSDTKELVQTATTVAGGSYTAAWYDNTIPVYVEARQDDAHVGRSRNGVAV